MFVESKYLYLAVTNKESYVKVKVCSCEDNDFHATVNATVFLQLMSKISSASVEFAFNDQSLLVNANGHYKIPLIYVDGEIATLETINLSNIIENFDVKNSILDSLSKYNSKQLSVGILNNAVQRMYYFDKDGALTFTSGACVNKFTANVQSKLLFNDRLVKLFKLFKDASVHVQIAADKISDEIIQTKVKFFTDQVEIFCILYSNDELLNAFPVKAIRNLENDSYKYLISLNKNSLVEMIDRLLVFCDDKDFFASGIFDVKNNDLTIKFGENVEVIPINSTNSELISYQTEMSLKDLKQILSSLPTTDIQIKFGNEKCFVIICKDISYIIPEIRN